jgi:putative ABC transport system ATP-binding protein
MSAEATDVVRLENVGFAWPDHHPLLDVPELAIAAGERVFLFGPSGSGKSTLLGLIAGIHLPNRGTVRLFGRDTSRLTPSARDRVRGDEMGFVFQQFNLIGYLSVLENVLLPLSFAPIRRARAGSSAEARRQADSLLARLDIGGHTSARRPTELSVGQQQRVAVARALLGSPRLIVCDEPTSALDADARDGFLDVLSAECARTGAALLFVSHDRSLARHFPRTLDMHDLNPLLRAGDGP